MTSEQKMNTTIINEGCLGNNEENHNNHNLQKFHQNDKVWIEQILDMYMMHNLLEQICSETVALEFI